MRPALANISIPLAQGLNIQGMVVAVGTVLGPAAVVTFSTLRTLTRLVVQLGHSISHATEPEIAGAYGTGDRALLRALFLQSLKVSFCLGLSGSLLLLLLGNPLLDLWTQGNVEMEPLLFGFLLLSACANAIWYGVFVVAKATNQHLKFSFTFAICSILVVFLATSLMKWTGKLEFACTTVLALDIVMTLCAWRTTSRITSIGLIKEAQTKA